MGQPNTAGRSAERSDGIRLYDPSFDARVDLKLTKNIALRVSGDSVFDGAQVEIDNAELMLFPDVDLVDFITAFSGRQIIKQRIDARDDLFPGRSK